MDELTRALGTRYGAITRLWHNAWHEFIPFLDYDVEIRTVICSMNAIESLNARYRRAVKARGHFPTEQVALKCRAQSSPGSADAGACPGQHCYRTSCTHREVFGVEPICTVLSEHGCKIAPSSYYVARNRQPSKRAVRDAEIVALIEQARDHQFRVRFGARKMWLYLRAQGHDVARCTVERLMATQGWAGALRGKKIRATAASGHQDRPLDLVDRDFTASRPNQLWVADFTSAATFAGIVYLAFIFDVFSRRTGGQPRCTKPSHPYRVETPPRASGNTGAVQTLAWLAI